MIVLEGQFFSSLFSIFFGFVLSTSDLVHDIVHDMKVMHGQR